MTQSARLLAYLRAHPGCTTMEISFGLHPFVSNPRARISDLRAEGHVIEAVRVDGVYRYRLIERAQLAVWA